MLSAIYQEFNTRLSEFGQCYLAGGSVRDHLMGKEAKDFDFFVLNNTLFLNFEETSKKIIEKLKDLEIVDSKVDWHKSEPYLVISVKYKEKEVQILLNPALSIGELLDSFDWSVCLFAYGDGGVFYQKESIENIKVGGELHLNKSTFHLSTLRRGFRFSERFLMKLNKETIYDLCEKILANRKLNNEKGPAGNEPDMPALAANSLVN